LSREIEIADWKEMELLGLLNEIIAKGGLPPSARDDLRYKRTIADN
jgi:hypothetical protein